MGIMTMMMLVVGLAFCACSSDDDNDEEQGSELGGGSGGSTGKLVGDWRLVKVVWSTNTGASGVNDYSDEEPDEDSSNYLRITDTELFMSAEAEFTDCDVYKYSVADGKIKILEGPANDLYVDEGYLSYWFDGSQLVLRVPYNFEREEYDECYYVRM